MTASPFASPPIASRRRGVAMRIAMGAECIRYAKNAASLSRRLTWRAAEVHDVRISKHLSVYEKSHRGIRDVKIGRQAHRSSAICASNEDTILVRGRDLAGELIGNVNFTDYFWLLLTGSVPSAAQRRVLDATLVAIAEHGLVPSVQASRM